MEKLNKMNIKNIKIGRTEYEVKRVDQFKGRTHIAIIDFDHKTITVAQRGGITNTKISRTEKAQAFWHEVVHGILHDMKHPLNHNEKFVDDFAKRLRMLVTPDMKEKIYEANLVTQRTKGLRKLREKVPRSASTKKVQAR